MYGRILHGFKNTAVMLPAFFLSFKYNSLQPSFLSAYYYGSAETVNTFKNRLDRFWSNQDVLYDYRADLHGIRNRTILM